MVTAAAAQQAAAAPATPVVPVQLALAVVQRLGNLAKPRQQQ
jgi:hypothetical protein